MVLGAPCDRVRWRKDHVLYRPNAEVADKPKTELENDSQVEGNLATEVSFIVLDTLEQIIQVKGKAGVRWVRIQLPWSNQQH